jgi:tetratricopeptide (TPR) repeat protein
MRAALPVLFLLSLLFGAGGAPGAPPAAALAEGNRLFAQDRIEPALSAYAGGWTGSGSPEDGALAYNAGNCALRLGRLPEALLWYRRAAAATPGDPWVRDNLGLARQALGGPPEGDLGGWRSWLAGGRRLAGAGVALAWAAFALLALARRPHRKLLAALALLSCGAFAAGMALDRRGPRAAVLLAACPGGPAAGAEVWVSPGDGEGFRILGHAGPLCPKGAVGLIAP